MIQSTIIDSKQLVMLLLLSRIFSTLTYMPSLNHSVDGNAALAGAILSFLLQIVVLIPAYLLLKRYSGYGILQCTQKISPILGRLVAILFWIYLMLNAVNTVGGFEFFLSTAVYPNASSAIFLVCIVLAAVYGVYCGLEAFSRVAVFAFIAFVAVILFLLVVLIPEYNTLRIISPFYYGAKPVLQSAYNLLVSNSEVIVLILMLPFVRGNIRRSFFSYAALTLIFIEIIAFMILAAMGDYARTQTYPFFMLTKVAEFSIFANIDSLHMALWVFLAFLKVCIYLFLAVDSFQVFAPQRIKKAGLWINSALLLTITYLLVQNIDFFYPFFQQQVPQYFFWILVLVVPLTFLLIDFMKKKAVPKDEKTG